MSVQTDRSSSTAVTAALRDADVEAFKARFRGPLLGPNDDGYERARRVWNGMIDRRPALIARCAGAADVRAAVSFARERDLAVSVRGGGHSVAGKAVCDDGVMIDLSLMKSIRVDASARTARVEPGVLWGEFDRETQAFGLATPGGLVSTTGVAGLALGGGQSLLTGKYGLTLDNLVSADVVIADGSLLRASATENADLFWGLRGAGANFGVVTSFEFRLHPVDAVLGGMVIHPLDRAGDVLRFYREFTTTEPDELTTYAALLTSPEGHPVVAIVTCYIGEPSEGERVVAPLRRFGTPIADLIGPTTYVAMQSLLGPAYPAGRLNYWKSSMTNEIPDELIDTLSDHAKRVPSPFTSTVLAECHGAYSRVGKSDTAYWPRDQRYDLVIISSWENPSETDRNIAWTRGFFDAIDPYLSRNVYVNDLGDEGRDRIRDAYGGNYDRLLSLKRRYDPANLFRMNQNIDPAV
jgi:UDP-N-acetylenolpyruvoylglucosamine reductase